MGRLGPAPSCLCGKCGTCRNRRNHHNYYQKHCKFGVFQKPVDDKARIAASLAVPDEELDRRAIETLAAGMGRAQHRPNDRRGR